MSMEKHWTCIVITCSSPASVISTEKEIKLLKKKGRISESVSVLTVEDPAKNIGSGAATLNALLVATEYLSVKQNYMVITSDAILAAHILILHNGRYNLFSSCEKAFISLPVEYTPKSNSDKLYASGILNNLEAAIQFIDELSVNSPPGVWVCSTDMTILHPNQKFSDLWETVVDVAMFCIPSDIDYATGHGVVSVDKEGYIADISYCAPIDQIEKLVEDDKRKKVPVVSGIVFLSTNVAESLLGLHAQTPLDCCTYLGLDSGNNPIQVSLFFDLLVAMSTNMNKTNFISGKCGKTYNMKVGLDKESSTEIHLARSLVWNELSKYKMSAKILDGCEHLYWSSCDCLQYHMSNLFKIRTPELVHSFCQVDKAISPKCLIMNSDIRAQSCQISPNVIISDCTIETNCLNVGENTFLSGITYSEGHSDLNIPANIAVINIETKESFGDSIIVVFGVQENLFVPINQCSGTFCDKSWLKFMKCFNTNEKEIWNKNLTSQEMTLANAKLFPLNLSAKEALQLFCCDNSDSNHILLLNRWKKSQRYSINEIMENIDYMKVLDYRRNVYCEISCKIIKKALLRNEDLYLLPYFYAACIEKWSHSIMATLDNVLLSNEKSSIQTRTLSCMADLLSAMAGLYGGLRSGPGNNRTWENAFQLLLNGPGIAGVKALLKERANWMDRPNHLMRAARHFERAAQILIQCSVMTVKQFITLSFSKIPEMGAVITVECPARIDLQGGWSDTPPICYELGGSVVNIAVLIDGKKPIGARASRIPEPHIKLKIGIGEMSHEVLIKDVKDVLNYDQPNAKGALLKAALVCSEIIDTTTETSLADQLYSKFGGGFEIHSWSLLPQGCGMGTSSILAGAIVAALWSISGRQFDKLSVIHAVLYVEQLLTTGGGWQDQVSGIIGGINRGFSDDDLPLNVKIDSLNLSEEIIQKLNAHFLLIYTGKVRLAKNLLQNVIRNWYAREKCVVKCFKDLLFNSIEMKKALCKGDFSTIGILMEKYWEQKKVLAPGCEPTSVKTVMHILRPLCYGQLLVGAGGGGYMCVITREANAKQSLQSELKKHKDYEKLSIHSVNIDLSGLTIS